MRFRKPRAMYGEVREATVNLVEIVRGQFDLNSTEVLFQTINPARARNGHDPGLLGEQPRKRDLRRSCFLPPRDSLQQLDDCPVLLPRRRGKGPYTSAVSKNVTPRSTAVWMRSIIFRVSSGGP